MDKKPQSLRSNIPLLYGELRYTIVAFIIPSKIDCGSFKKRSVRNNCNFSATIIWNRDLRTVFCLLEAENDLT